MSLEISVIVKESKNLIKKKNNNTHGQKMKNEYFKKPRQILAIAKANPYLPHACGTFTGSPPASPSSAPLETWPSNKPRSSTDKDTMVGTKIHAGAGTSGTAQSSDNDSNNVHSGGKRETCRSAEQLYASVSHWSRSMTVCVEGIQRAGTVCRYKVIPLLSSAISLSCFSYLVSAPVLCLGLSTLCKALWGGPVQQRYQPLSFWLLLSAAAVVHALLKVAGPQRPAGLLVFEAGQLGGTNGCVCVRACARACVGAGPAVTRWWHRLLTALSFKVVSLKLGFAPFPFNIMLICCLSKNNVNNS